MRMSACHLRWTVAQSQLQSSRLASHRASWGFRLSSPARDGPCSVPDILLQSPTLFTYAMCIVFGRAPCALTAAPICHFAHAVERHLQSTFAPSQSSFVQYCTHARTHERTYANPSPKAHDGNPCALLSTTRPALTAGPPSQRPFLSGLANCYAPCRRLCIAKRAPKFTPDLHLRPAGTGD
jgi:hypothetical protein